MTLLCKSTKMVLVVIFRLSSSVMSSAVVIIGHIPIKVIPYFSENSVQPWCTFPLITCCDLLCVCVTEEKVRKLFYCRFWPGSVGASANVNDDTVFYKQLTPQLCKALRRAFANGSMGKLTNNIYSSHRCPCLYSYRRINNLYHVAS